MGMVLALCLVVLGACGGDSSSPADANAGSPKASGTLTGEQGWPRVEGLRGKRYCEVLLLRIVDAHLNGEVWNSYGLNDCPQEAWSALDPAAIKAERGVIAVLLNGPRYWLMDSIEKKPGERQETMFGALRMFRAATVDIGPIPPNLAPYTVRHVARESVFEYAGGSEVYELVDPDGKAYIMQAYSVQQAPLTEADLPGIGARINPPAGWGYRSRKLDSTLRVGVGGKEATVIQDDLSNTYSLIETE